MGLLDGIEKKTMRNYQSFLAGIDIHVDLGTTFCGNTATYPCNRDHQCITFRESRARGATMYFYRCGGHVWLNGSDGKTSHIGPWSNSVGEEAGFIGYLITRHESSDS